MAISRSTLGTIAGVLAIVLLALAPEADARQTAKFKVLSITGTETSTRDVVYAPSIYGSCAWTQVERIRFQSTKRVTAYAFSSKAHGRARVEWASKPDFVGNLTQVPVPGELSISRSATYQQTNYTDPDTGEIFPGCYNEFSPVNCTVDRTFAVTLNMGGTSGEESTYVEPEFPAGALNALDDACPVGLLAPNDAPLLFSPADVFNRKKKRPSDTDRVDQSYDTSGESETNTGTIVQELSAELKRRKPPRKEQRG